MYQAFLYLSYLWKLFNGNYSNLNDKQFVDEREQRIFAFCGFYEDPVTKISLI